MQNSLWFLALMLATTGPALAQTAFDGRWADPSGSCTSETGDTLPMKISAGNIQFYESVCTLTNPVDLRDINGQLFDIVCTGEGEQWSYRALLLLNDDGTLVFSGQGRTSIYDRCE